MCVMAKLILFEIKKSIPEKGMLVINIRIMICIVVFISDNNMIISILQ
jgi:hypothetical protein